MVNKLEEMCAVKIVATFCCRPDVKERFLEINLLPRKETDLVFGEEILKLKKILELQLLNEVKNLPDQITCIVRNHFLHYIVNEIMQCLEFHLDWFGLTPKYILNILNGSHLTHRGALDYSLIAKNMVQDENLSVLLRIGIAIGSCLIDDVRVLWGEIGEGEKILICNGKFIEKYKFSHQWWSKPVWKGILYLAIKNEQLKILMEIDAGFDLFKLNEIVFKYNWSRLRLSEKKKISLMVVESFYFVESLRFFPLALKRFRLDRKKMGILRFVLCNLNEEVLKEILLNENLISNHLLVLKLLLFWPYQNIFMKMLNLVWETITHIRFYELLHSILDMIEDDEISKTYDYKLILKEVWRAAPSDYKKFVGTMESENIRPSLYLSHFFTFEKEGVKFPHLYEGKHESKITFLLSRLFRFQIFTDDDVMFVKMIASDFTASEKEKIVSTQGDDICENALLSGKQWRADLFIECFVEKDLICEYKEGFLTRRGKNMSEVLLSSGKRWLPFLNFNKKAKKLNLEK